MPFGMKMPSIEVEIEVKAPSVEVEVKVPEIEVEVEIKAPKVPSISIEIEVEVKAPKMPAIEVEVPSVDMHAIEAEIRARLEAEAESRIAAAVAAATANMKCKMEQALELAVAEAVAEANRCCDVRCAAEVAAALKGAECKPAPAPARIAIPADAIFDAHIDKLMCRARKKFDFFDLDGNGLLDGDELVHLGEWLWSCFHPGEEASEQKKEAEGLKTLFRHDENGDGALSFEEFEGWFRKTCAAIEKYRRGLAEKPNLKVKPPVKQKMPARERIAIPADAIFDAHIDKLMCRARKKFDQFDEDGNELLEGDELVHLGEWLWSSFHPGEEASEEKKEAEGLKLLFRQDENGDGALSFEEFEGWFRKTCAAIEKYRRGLSQKPNLKVKAPVKQKMPEIEKKPEILSAAQRIRAAEHAPLAPPMVELSPLSFYAHPMAHLAHFAPPAPMGIRATTYESMYAFGYSSLPHAHPVHAHHPFEYHRRF